MSDTDDTNDGEGVWSPDIEQCFREALLLFPPCGRRKHILQEEGGGKMYGRNELIARHIMMRTGKVRTRKQVSSHIQVLARRKAKTEAATGSNNTGTPSPASSVGAANIGHNRTRPINNAVVNDSGAAQIRHPGADSRQRPTPTTYDVWADRPVVTQKIRLVEFSAFIEYRVPSILQNSLPATTNLENQVLNQTAALTSLATAAAAAPSIDIEGQEQQAVNFQNRQASQIHQPATSPYGEDIPQTAVNPQLPQHHATHPLALNHQVPAQFNQANSYQINNQQPLNNNQSHQPSLLLANDLVFTGATNQNAQPQPGHQQASIGFTRHSYVKLDYRQPICRQTNKLERIDIGQIQDKFPELDGIYQRGPPDAFFLVKFWADINDDYEYSIEDQNSYFGFSCSFETIHPYKDITCSTKACSYGLQVVEKVEKIFGAFNNTNGRYTYDISRSSMCEFMIQFIKKLRQLPRTSQMNSVLEHFTVLQIVTNEATSEILLCLAYAFEITSPEQNGSQYHVYKLTKD